MALSTILWAHTLLAKGCEKVALGCNRSELSRGVIVVHAQGHRPFLLLGETFQNLHNVLHISDGQHSAELSTDPSLTY